MEAEAEAEVSLEKFKRENSPLGKSGSGKSRGGGSLQMFSRSDFPDGSKVSIRMLNLLVNIASIGIM